ncbi:MAG: glutathione S-transferase family protein, partial [Alphaproteobacteria bacterium]|nr:glutathione S-transferase family protein [Alphaproteobacteria bacterium]
LEELGLPFTEITLDRDAGALRAADYLRLNPLGRVPTLVDDGFVLTETPAILLYLADKHPERGLTPRAGTPERARMEQWIYLAQNELEPALTFAFKLRHRVPEAEKLPAVLPFCRAQFDEAAAVLEAHVADRPHLLDSGFSVADVILACVLSWAEADGFMVGFPNLERYRKAQLSRPAATRAFATDPPS